MPIRGVQIDHKDTDMSHIEALTLYVPDDEPFPEGFYIAMGYADGQALEPNVRYVLLQDFLELIGIEGANVGAARWLDDPAEE